MADSRVALLIDLGEGNRVVQFKDEDEALAWLHGPGAALNDHVHDVAPIVSRRSLIRAAKRRP
ncbi:MULTISPECIES: hypothetical protein [unclassified Aeromicrobium]|uniref:hypothetical protein n=1 Tax=unclassified Aeromicrobium TaxID=2633570 RepID=UPI002889BA2E|nr:MULTISPECIES: hypothetical protein [unclassified Aeromicrobium]